MSPLSPTDAAIDQLFNTAVDAYQSQRKQEAQRLCQELLRLAPHHGNGWHLDGVLAMEQGQHQEAVEKVRRAIQCQDTVGAYHETLAWGYIRLQQWQNAVDAAQQALHRQATLTEAHYAMGIALRRLGRSTAAKAALQQGVARRPAHVNVLCDMAADLIEKKDLVGAGFFLRAALTLDPHHVSSLINYAILLQEENKFDQASDHFRRALALEPGNIAGLLNLTALLLRLDQPEEAVEHLQWLIDNAPPTADILSKMGTAHHLLAKTQQAIAYYRQALALDPQHSITHWELSLSLLSAGELTEGFREYEWRWHVDALGTKKRPGRYWQGVPEQVHSLFLHGEQGLGDLLQFARYIPMVTPYAQRVVLVCPESVVGLFQSVPGVDRIITNVAASGEEVDAYYPLMSLPHAFGTTLETIPAPIPYLTVPADLVTRWHHRLAAITGFRVGIVWRGNPDHRNDARRSAPLTLFATLAALPGVSLISLQKQYGLDELQHLPTVHTLGSEWQDLLDTAAVILNLDLVVTVDTAVAHLAGALGKPVWIALPRSVDWRWMQERSDSPWYPTARLFRQGPEPVWPPVFEQMTTALAQVLQGVAPLHDLSNQRSPLQTVSPEQMRLTALYQSAGQATQARQWSQVAALYQQVVALSPTNVQAWLTLGKAYMDNNELQKACQSFQSGLAMDPNHPALHGLLGVALAQSNQRAEAIRYFDEAIRLNPKIAEFHFNRGQALRTEKKFPEALASLLTAASLHPTSPEILIAIGNVYFQQREWNKAISHLLAALVWLPDHYETHQVLGLIFKQTKQIEKALFHAEKARLLQPDNPAVYINLGVVYMTLHRDQEAERCYRKALFLDGKNSIAHLNLASVFMGRGENDEAQGMLERAIALDPDYGEARLHLAFILLGKGRWERGFREYEWRWQTDRVTMPTYPHPIWDGQPMADGTLLVWSEQGVGDTLHFVRYLPLLRPLVGRLIFRCPTSLVALISDMHGVDQVVDNKQPLPHFDRHLPLISAPHRLAGLVAGVEHGTPYLAANVARMEKWQDAVTTIPGLRVGVVWQGNPDYPQDVVRSFHVSCLTALTQVAGVSLLSLQVGFGSEQLDDLPVPIKIHRLPAPLADFADTAAVLAHLDLVISADTAVAHLALAMGKPVWIATYKTTDWRWMSGAPANPWYGNVRIFCQQRAGEWAPVFDKIHTALANHLQKPREFKLVEPIHPPHQSQQPWVNTLAKQILQAMDLVKAGSLEQASDLVNQLLNQAPQYPPLIHLAGFIALRQGSFHLAVEKLSQAVERHPQTSAFHSHLGCAHLALGQLDQAEASLRQAISLDGGAADHHYNLGNVLKSKGDDQKAIVAFQKTLALQPGHYQAWVNQGTCHLHLNDILAGEHAFREAIQINPNGANAHFGLARALLSQGHWQQGFREYEWRWQLPGLGRRQLPGLPWDGQPHTRSSLFLHHEQGLGDFIHFSRYLPLVHPHFQRVVAQIPAPLVTLYQDFPVEWLPMDAPIPPCDFHASLLSLPAMMGLTDEQIESMGRPYLTSPPPDTPPLAKKPGEIWVGMCWQGKASHVNDANRSIPLTTLAPLAKQRGVRLFSLQHGPAGQQVQQWPGPLALEQPVAEWQDFGQLAQFMTHLDVVISVDSAVAHLAGALGKTVWTLLPWSADWRWMTDRPTTHWYDAMRLFRQHAPGRWHGVVEQISQSLQNFTAPPTTQAVTGISAPGHRLFILQHGLATYDSHYYTQTKGMVAYCHTHQITPCLYIHQEALPEIVHELNGKAIFHARPDIRLFDKNKKPHDHSDYFLSRQFADQCRILSEDGLCRDDALILPYVSTYELSGLVQWLESVPEAGRPSLLLNFHRPDFSWRLDGDGQIIGKQEHFRDAAQTIHRLTGGRVHLTATSASLARILAQITDLPCAAVPVAVPLAQSAPLPALPEQQRFRVGVMGSFRPEQGSNLSPAILEQFCRARPGQKVFMQVINEAQLTTITPAMQACAQWATVSVHVGILTQDFLQQMQRMDILLLPYLPAHFYARSSGVFAMAVSLGKPVVVPEGTWMADQIAQGHGVGEIFSPCNIAEATKALIRCHDNFDALQELAMTKRQAWIKRHNLTTWMAQIMETLRWNRKPIH